MTRSVTLLLWSIIILSGAGCALPPLHNSAKCAAAPACPACPACPAVTKPAPQTARYVPTGFDLLPGWRDVHLAPSLRTFIKGCTRIRNALRQACAQARAVPVDDEGAARRFFEQTFAAFAIVSGDGSDSGLITGYYEPVLPGSRTQTAQFRQPIYGIPADMVVVDLASQYPALKGMRLRGRLEGRRLVPYAARGEIESAGGSGSGRFSAPVIAWTADAVELFFLQVQGSGQIDLGAAGRIRVGYADQNGHPYRSLGRYLIDQGELSLEQASMQGIKAWAASHPERIQQALNHNPSYVFFRELPANDGPIGSLGVPLSAETSVAVDRRFIPLGAPAFLETTYPNTSRPLARLVIAQDTGGAVRGAVRADFYWGSGEAAGEQAGRMRQSGRMWLLWPRGAALPQQ